MSVRLLCTLRILALRYKGSNATMCCVFFCLQVQKKLCPVLLHSSAHPRVIAPKSVPKMSYLLQKIISWAIRPWDFAPPCLIGVPIQKQWLLPLLFHDSWNPRRSPRKLSRHLDRVKLPNQNNKAISSSNSNVQGEWKPVVLTTNCLREMLPGVVSHHGS